MQSFDAVTRGRVTRLALDGARAVAPVDRQATKNSYDFA